jgi:hypothetical protein
MKNLKDEIQRSRKLMGLSEGLNLVKKQYDLIDRVIEEIKNDIINGDYEALDELLQSIPKENLIWYLPEKEWESYKNWDPYNRPEPQIN